MSPPGRLILLCIGATCIALAAPVGAFAAGGIFFGILCTGLAVSDII
jgi:hypothetical protein